MLRWSARRPKAGSRTGSSGLLAEVVASLGLVMLAATLVLAGLLIVHNESRLEDLLGRALLAEARSLPAPDRTLVPGTQWWRVDAAGRIDPFGGGPRALDPATRELVAAVRASGNPLVRPGAPWEPVRFATPSGDGVLAARLPAAASLRLRAFPLALVAALLLIDVLVFTAFGASLLRRRVVAPLERLAAATRGLAEGGFEARVPVEGPRETVEVAIAWNAMSAALALRTQTLEKTVAELRDTNAELRLAQSGLDRAQRLAAVGRLAAGVAHEVGNPLAALLAFLSVAQRDAGMSAESHRHLSRAADQGERVRRILQQLLAYSRPPRMQSLALDLEPLAEETVTAVSAQRRYAGVRFCVRRDSDVRQAFGDPGAVAQILLNLVLNAADAVSGAGDGTGAVAVLVRPAHLALRAGDSRDAASAQRPPDAVECVVCDEGPGIAEEDRERLFDPFFTTKPPGEGTGLGLANSLRLAEELGGVLELVEPPPGFRTAFALRLREADRPAGACGVRNALRSASGPAIRRES